MAGNKGAKKSHDIAKADPGGAGSPAAAQHCVIGGPEATVHRYGLVAGLPETVRNGLGPEADFSYWQCYEGGNGPIAQLDRVTDFYSVGCRFESCWDRHY
jgi:hypothetical protein